MNNILIEFGSVFVISLLIAVINTEEKVFITTKIIVTVRD